MKYILGIDVGGTTTKIVGFRNGDMVDAIKVSATDPVASLYGAFGKFTSTNMINLTDIERIMVTGVGSSFITKKMFGLPTGLVTEFSATGLGGLYLSGLENGIVCSVGTGTAFVSANKHEAVHLGGTGVGGGTLLGLSGQMINMHSFENIMEAASEGDLSNVDLTIGDISRSIDSTLDLTMTAANFGKVSDKATKADLALGIINLVCETIGMMSVFALRGSEVKQVVLTGTLVTQPLFRKKFEELTKLLGVSFIIPRNAEFATAVGASLAFRHGWSFTEV
ncbi:MAG: type II pantothenate kinase [Oscillospiraceae bacterium]|jgi:type II pantothenate kinase